MRRQSIVLAVMEEFTETRIYKLEGWCTFLIMLIDVFLRKTFLLHLIEINWNCSDTDPLWAAFRFLSILVDEAKASGCGIPRLIHALPVRVGVSEDFQKRDSNINARVWRTCSRWRGAGRKAWDEEKQNIFICLLILWQPQQEVRQSSE